MTQAQILGGLLSMVAGAALAWAAGAATVPQLWVQYAMPGDTSPRKAEPVIIKAPLTLTRNAAGKLELSSNLPLVGLLASGCSTDAAGTLTCPKVTFPAPVP